MLPCGGTTLMPLDALLMQFAAVIVSTTGAEGGPTGAGDHRYVWRGVCVGVGFGGGVGRGGRAEKV